MVPDITITSLETINAYHITSGDFLFSLDELQSADIANTQETTDITGKGGRKLNKLKKNKAVTVSGSNGMVSGGLMELQTGSSFELKDTEVEWIDYLTVSSDAAETDYVAVGTTGAEITNLFIKNNDGTLGDELTQSDTAAEGVFTYDPTTKALGFSGVDDDTQIVVIYKRKINANVLSNVSDTYSSKCSVYINAFGEDKCGNVYRIQFYIPKADFSGEFSFDLGGDQTVHSFEFEALSGACGTSGELWTYTIFGNAAEDAA